MKYDQTDPEYMERLRHFAFTEVIGEEGQQLENEPRYLAILAVLVGCQGTDLYRLMLSEALDNGLSPVAVKEMVYQSTDYLGMGRTWPFLAITNNVLEEHDISLPLSGQATTTLENRLEKGAETQAVIFGEQMREAWKKSTVNRWLAANCFGDYYTRTGLTLAQRELITFCFLAAQGGCEPQLMAHIAGNLRLGNTKEFLRKVVLQCLPYIGYPRSLNAIACIDKVDEK